MKQRNSKSILRMLVLLTVISLILIIKGQRNNRFSPLPFAAEAARFPAVPCEVFHGRGGDREPEVRG